MFLKNKNIIFKIRRSKITDYAALIKWLRPKGLKVCSYAEKCTKFKNQTLKRIRLVHKSAMRNGIPRGYAVSQNSAKMGVPLLVYTLNHVIYI